MRLSTTPLGVVGAGWVLYSVGVLGAVYGFLFLPPRGWGLLQVTGALALLLGVLIVVSEILGRWTHTKLTGELEALPFGVAGYPGALGDVELDNARLEISFASAAPEQAALAGLVAELDAPWLTWEQDDGTVALVVADSAGEGTNWRLHQRVHHALQHVCVPAHELAEMSSVAVSASASSARTSSSDE